MATPSAWSAEFQVNTISTASQQRPRVAALKNGLFIVVWADYSGYAGDPATADDAFEAALRAQLFDAQGNKLGIPFLVNTTTAASQYEPAIIALPSGGFAVAWSDNSLTGADQSSTAVRAQCFAADGSRTGAELLVNTTTAGPQFEPSITALNDGRLVLVWSDFSGAGADPFGSAIRAQILTADGAKQGDEVLVNTTTNASQRQPCISALRNGGFVVVWSDDSETAGDASGAAVRGQLFQSDGSRSGGEFLVNTTTSGAQEHPTVVTLSNGRFVVAWQDQSPSLGLPGSTGDTAGTAVKAQMFSANGLRIGSEILVNTTTAGNQDSANVTPLAGGGFLVTWTDALSNRADDAAPGTAVRAQAFHANGSKDGEEFLVNNRTIGNQWQPASGTLADGRVLIAWTDTSNPFATPDDNSSEVRARLFDPRDGAVTLRGSLADDQLIGTSFGDVMSGLNGNDRLRGEASADRLFGGSGNDTLLGDSGDDSLEGGDGDDLLNGGSGVERMRGGSGNDVYFIDSIADRIIEAPGAAGGRDEVRSTSLDLDLNQSNSAHVEIARLLGAAALNLNGSAAKDVLVGNEGSNVLTGRAGCDRLVGHGGSDTFMLTSSDQADVILDFVTGSDTLAISASNLPIGNGDRVIDAAVTINGPGGFATNAELVILSQDIGAPITPGRAAAAIGSAQTAYGMGETRLFLVDDGMTSLLYMFNAANADAMVSASELTPLALLSGVPALAAGDLQFSV